jgi:TonB family protein
MNRRVTAFACILVISSFGIGGEAQVMSPQQKAAEPQINVEVLTDVGHANLTPYVRDLASDLRQHWLPLVASATGSPMSASKEVVIRIVIKANGQLGSMRLESPLRGEEAEEKAAWQAITQVAFQPPPSGMVDQDLGLRLHFVTE